MAHGEATHVHLVDDAFMPGRPWRPIFAPSEGSVHHSALRHAERTVAAVEGEVLAGMPHAITEMRVTPVEGAINLLGVGIQQQLVMIESLTPTGLVRSVHAIAI